jgi:hypothetical protein
MGVEVHEPRSHEAPSGVEDRGTAGHGHVGPDLGDDSRTDEDVGDTGTPGVDDGSTPDQDMGRQRS